MLTPEKAVLCRLVRAMYKFDKSQMLKQLPMGGNDSRFPIFKKVQNVAHFFSLQILTNFQTTATRAAPEDTTSEALSR